MVKIEMHKKRNLEDIQKELQRKGELINDQNTVTHAEKIIGQALIDAKIPVIPQFDVEGRSYDFKVYHYPILIEIDGGIHNTEHKRINDYVKDRFVQRRGFRVYRFANFETYDAKFLRKAISEVRSMMRYCGKQPKEVYLYPLTIVEQFKMWILKLKGKKWQHSIKVNFLK